MRGELCTESALDVFEVWMLGVGDWRHCQTHNDGVFMAIAAVYRFLVSQMNAAVASTQLFQFCVMIACVCRAFIEWQVLVFPVVSLLAGVSAALK